MIKRMNCLGKALPTVHEQSAAPLTGCFIFMLTALVLILVASQATASERQVREAMERFISAFELGDINAMEAAFAEDAVTFPRSIMANGLDETIDTSTYRRVRGMPPQMREIIVFLQASGREPPYLSLEPRDLEVQMYGGAALVTFHLEGNESLGRRTFVLALIDDDWKIVHLHASNVVGSR